MKVLGVDPGRKGAAALFTGGRGVLRRSIQIVDLPYDDEGKLVYRAYRDLIIQWKPDVAYIENVWPRSKRAPNAKDGMGFITSNKFMKGVGALEGITSCFVDDAFMVVPTVWKKMFGLIKHEGEDRNVKKEARKLCGDLFFETIPMVRRVEDDGRAEAVLIAVYGAVRQGLIKLEPIAS
jgi:hypothetical protein